MFTGIVTYNFESAIEMHMQFMGNVLYLNITITVQEIVSVHISWAEST